MTEQAKLKTYAKVAGPNKPFPLFVPRDATVQAVRNLFKTRFKRSDLNHLWHAGEELLDGDDFSDWWKEDALFVLTANDVLPKGEDVKFVSELNATQLPPSPASPPQPAVPVQPVKQSTNPPPQPAASAIRAPSTVPRQSAKPSGSTSWDFGFVLMPDGPYKGLLEVRIPPDFQDSLHEKFGGKALVSAQATSPSGNPAAFRYKRGADKSCVYVNRPKDWPLEHFRLFFPGFIGIAVTEEAPPPQLSPMQWRACSYLALCIDIPPSRHDFQDIRRIPAFLPELWGQLPTDLPPPGAFTECSLAPMSPFYASLLVEMFAVNQSDSEKTSVTKRFLERPTVYRFVLPVELPVLVAMEDGGAVFRFATVGEVAADVVKRQLEFAIMVLRYIKIVEGQFSRVAESAFPKGRFQTVSKELGFAVLQGDVRPDVVISSTVCFSLYALPNQTGPAPRELFRLKCQGLLKEARCWRCSSCRDWVSRDQPCVFVTHTGERKPFEDGKMIQIEDLGDGSDPIRYENWDCCGKHLEGDPGCCPFQFESHSDPDLPGTQVVSEFHMEVWTFQ
jgi:hypothetical protein